MSDVLRVQWTIIPRTAPQPWLSCNRCGGPRRFQTSGKIRVNANGKRLDAWLIYGCISCGNTWNRPILERQHVRTINPQFLMSLRANEPALARRLAFDVEALKRRAGRVEESDDVRVIKNVLAENTVPARKLEILCAVPEPTGLRVDRLLASELHISRSWLQRLEEAGELVVFPEGSRLRRTVRDGTLLVMNLSGANDSFIAVAARSVRGKLPTNQLRVAPGAQPKRRRNPRAKCV